MRYRMAPGAIARAQRILLVLHVFEEFAHQSFGSPMSGAVFD